MNLQELNKLISGATDGPWDYCCAKSCDNTGGYDYAIMDKDRKIIAETFEHVGESGLGYDQRPSDVNAELIAASRQALPQALEVIEKCKAALGLISTVANEEFGLRDTEQNYFAQSAALSEVNDCINTISFFEQDVTGVRDDQ